MNPKILVTYATKYGSTREIAEKIGAVLCREGLEADILPVELVHDLNPYRAVILGSGVYIGQWNKSAASFFRSHEKNLAGMPVWLFSSGPSGAGDPVALVDGWRLPTALQPIADRVHPRDVAVFHGDINLEKINFLEKWAIKNIVKKPFGDYRDWEMISSWASAVADDLKAQ